VPDSTLWQASLAGGDVQVAVSREQLERLARPLVDKTLAAVRKVLRDAKVTRTKSTAW
jgi:molecular chaperone HscA